MNEYEIVHQLVQPVSLTLCDMYLEANARVDTIIKDHSDVFNECAAKALRRRIVNGAMQTRWQDMNPNDDWCIADNSGFFHLRHVQTGLCMNLRAIDWATNQVPEATRTKSMRARYTQHACMGALEIQYDLFGNPILSDVTLMLVGDDSDLSKPFLSVYKPISLVKQDGKVPFSYMFDLAHTSKELQQELQFIPTSNNEDLLSLMVETEPETNSILF